MRWATMPGSTSWPGTIAPLERSSPSTTDPRRVHTGDGFLATFLTVNDAVAAAVDLQRTFRDHRRLAGFAPQIRIGIHVGEVSDVSGNIAGVEVHKTARVASAAGGDQILVSVEGAEQVGKNTELGGQREIPAKGIDAGMQVREVRLVEVKTVGDQLVDARSCSMKACRQRSVVLIWLNV